jgi:hypothetical protein
VQEEIKKIPISKKKPVTNLMNDRIREFSPIQSMKKTNAVSAKKCYSLLLTERGRAIDPTSISMFLLKLLIVNNQESVLS